MAGVRPEGGVLLAGQVAGFAAITVASCEALRWVVDFSMTQAMVDLVGAQAFLWSGRVCWVVEVAGTAVAAAGLVVGCRAAGPRWCRGAVTATVGLVLLWGWHFLARNVDLWGLHQLSVDDPLLPQRAEQALWTELGVAVLAILLLVWGGVRLLREGRKRKT